MHSSAQILPVGLTFPSVHTCAHRPGGPPASLPTMGSLALPATTTRAVSVLELPAMEPEAVGHV